MLSPLVNNLILALPAVNPSAQFSESPNNLDATLLTHGPPITIKLLAVGSVIWLSNLIFPTYSTLSHVPSASVVVVVVPGVY